jgi:hypothetical protein
MTTHVYERGMCDLCGKFVCGETQANRSHELFRLFIGRFLIHEEAMRVLAPDLHVRCQGIIRDIHVVPAN